jgi:signal transduction histidine kinase
MSFRTRLFLGILAGVLLPLGALAFGVRREMDRRLTAEYEHRVASVVERIEADLAAQGRAVAGRLSALGAELSRDNRFRLAALRGDPASRQYLLDYAGNAMRLSGLTMLQIQDTAGRILSSGHFRNEFDRLQPELPGLVGRESTLVLVRTRTAESPMMALVRGDLLLVGGRRYTLVGGIDAGAERLAGLSQAGDLSVALALPGTLQVAPPQSRVVREITLPYVDLLSNSPAMDRSRLVISQSRGTLEALRRSVDRWFLTAVAITAGVALLLAAWLSGHISSPLRALAKKTSEIDLDRLEQDFDSLRHDEVGALSRVLAAMTGRLRASSARLREVERRAAVGDLARQVNHDIKNGLAPIRNVLRHFAQVAEQEPDRLAGVFGERKGTLDSSIEYLDTLAGNYARLSPNIERVACDVNSVVERVLRNTPVNGTVLQARLSEASPMILGDTLMLRRILENLVGNAVDSTAGKAGATVTVTTETVAKGEGEGTATVRITVADSGPGMTRKQLDQAFDDFYTTKPEGTGLGLSIVRRLILDLTGTLRVETSPGAGTSVIIELPAATRGQSA